MRADVSHLLAEWAEAGLIDESTAARIRDFEHTRSGSARMRWPVLIALIFGSLTAGAGVLLFVSAHWDGMSPQARFALVILLVAAFHVAGALLTDRFPAMSSALHGIGAAALGAGIYLAGQIFNLDEHWPGGLMLWAFGAAVAAAILKQAPQLGLTAILAPAWLASEWFVATNELRSPSASRVLACGLFLLSLVYFTSAGAGRAPLPRRVLKWVGGVALLFSAPFLAYAASEGWYRYGSFPSPSTSLLATGWACALGIPLALAVLFRGGQAWPHAVTALWILVLLNLHFVNEDILLYVWWMAGAVGLVAWGVQDARPERINVGAAIFAVTVLAFYFSHVMDKLGRSLSLIGLGLIFLLGGWALERLRRRLVQQVRSG